MVILGPAMSKQTALVTNLSFKLILSLESHECCTAHNLRVGNMPSRTSSQAGRTNRIDGGISMAW
jgi:hypothetical protein